MRQLTITPPRNDADHLQRKRDRRRLVKERKKLKKLFQGIAPSTSSESSGEGSDSSSVTLSKSAKRRRKIRQRTENATNELYMGNVQQVSNCWFTTCWFDNIPIEALVDTGAEASVIASRAYRLLGRNHHSQILPSMTQFRGIGGSQGSLGTANFEYTIGNKEMVTNMHIVDLPHIDMILGMNAFIDENVNFRMSEGILQFPGDESVKLARRGEAESTQVHTKGPIKLKAKQARFIEAAPIYGDGFLAHQDLCLVEPMDHVFDRFGVLAGTTLVKKRSGSSISVYVMNTTDRHIELKMGTPIAKISTVQDVTSFQNKNFVEMHNLCVSQFHNPGHISAANPTDLMADIDHHRKLIDQLKTLDINQMCHSTEEKRGETVGLHYAGVEQNLQDNDVCAGQSCVDTSISPQERLLDEHMRPVIQGIDIKGEDLLASIELLKRYQDVFVGPDGKLGCTEICDGHRIDTGDTLPVRQRLRRLPPKRRQIVQDYVQELLAQKCIKPSNSDWATPVVIVTKKDGSPRFCLDYRKLNAVTIKDAFPLPRIDDALDQLAFKKYYCTFDLASGFYQLPMHPKDSHKTAFITHEGLYEWLVLPMGLSNSPATFQRCMAQVLKGLIPKRCLAYLDDIIVFGDDYEDTMQNLELVFQRLRQANLKLKPKKCRIFQTEVAYLGHLVSHDGIRTDPKKIESIKTWPTPCDVKGVRSFLGIASYYRKFIPNFSSIAHPLTRLTEKDVKFQWSDEETRSFDSLKKNLISSPILTYPTDKDKYVVDTDASNYGIGAVLSQVQNGVERVIAYASKSLTKSQRRYCTTKRELLAVVHFVSVTFRHYLIGEPFTIRTDHSSLTWLTGFKDADGMLARWLTMLAPFIYTIEHRKGDLHLNADALSRRPPKRCPREDCLDCHPDSELEDCNILQVMNQGQQAVQQELLAATPAGPTAHGTRHQVNVVSLMALRPIQDERVGWSIDRLRDEQGRDPDISSFVKLLQKYTGERPGSDIIKPESQDVKLFWTMWDEFFIRDDILYRQADPKHWSSRYVVPLKFRSHILCYLHRNPLMAHLGVYRTTSAAVKRFYWPRMRADIRRYIKSCLRCEMSKPGPGKGKMALIQEIAGAPNERVAMDLIVHYPVSKRGNTNILTIGDYFSKYFVAVPLPNRTAETVARAFIEHWICRTGGCPLTVHTDQGKELTGHIMTHLWEMMGVKPTRTLPYRPQSDGMVERFNSTIKQMLKSAVGANENNWDDYLPFCNMAYNATEQASTGCTPNMLAMASELRLPVDVMFGDTRDKRPWIRPDGSINYHVYVEWQRSMMIKSFAAARENLRKAATRQQRGYNVHLKERAYAPGDWVFKWYMPVASKKLGRGWRGPFVVTRVISDVVYEIQYHPTVRPRTVHVDHLKKCFSWADRDNWVKNPDYQDPRDPHQLDPYSRETEMDEILSYEGEDDFDFEDLLKDKPPPAPRALPNPANPPPAAATAAEARPGILPNPPTPPARATPGNLPHPPDKHASLSGSDGGRPSEQRLDRSHQADSDTAFTGVTRSNRDRAANAPLVNDSGPGPPSPPKTRCGRVTRPPDRYTAK